MSLAYKSVATIDSPQFINLQPLDINPLMSKCDIKVFYIGENRNETSIPTVQTATKIAKTLRGAPIVGYFKQSKGDFSGHGEQLILDDEGFHFSHLTRPYGFVSPDAPVWFQKFQEIDQTTGEEKIRTYLMTEGFLWTGQYPEANLIYEDGGKPGSMELDKESLDGYWTKNSNNGMDFFIINDAIFSKICILGDDVQPCYEGAGFIAPSTTFTKNVDASFKKTLSYMMSELKNALLLKGENKDMDNEIKNIEAQPSTKFSQDNLKQSSDFKNQVVTEGSNPLTEYEKAEEKKQGSTNSSQKNETKDSGNNDEKKEKTDSTTNKTSESEVDNKDEEVKTQKENETDDDDEKKGSQKYALLQQELENLRVQYNNIKSSYESLLSFKKKIEDEQKDALINEFFMLSDEDKKDVIENKSNYSLKEIKEKLSVICFDKRVNFSRERQNDFEDDKKEDVTTTFSMTEKSVPDWVKEVEAVQNNI